MDTSSSSMPVGNEESKIDPALMGMTPLQRLILIILRKRVLLVPRRLMSSRREDAVDDGQEDVDEEEEEHAQAHGTGREEELVQISVFDLDDGIVDLSSLPRIAPYVAHHAKSALLGPAVSDADRKRILRGFSSTTQGGGAKKSHKKEVCLPFQTISEKEVDFSNAASAQRLVEVLQYFFDECSASMPSRTAPGIVSLALRRCNLVNADHLVSCLKKHRIHSTLRALDLSYNEIESLRLLFLLRSTFSEQLLFLSLRSNPITMKPDYREQVKRTLPNIISLDGEKIRSKPLSLPYPKESNVVCDDVGGGAESSVMSKDEVATVLDAVAELFHAWETQRVTIAKDDDDVQDEDSGENGQRGEAHAPKNNDSKMSIEIDEKTFAARYFSPGLFFSLTTAAGCTWFDPDRMKLKTDMEFDSEFDGFRLSAIDMKELHVMDVCMRNASRSLNTGRVALNRLTQGQYQCFTAYQSTLYPQRFDVDHHFSSSRVSITKLPSMTVPAPPPPPPMPAAGKKGKGVAKKAPAISPFTATDLRKKPPVYLVTIHGIMSWRTPSMQDGENIQCAFDRTLTFIKAPRSVSLSVSTLGPMTDVERHHVEMTLSNELLHRHGGKRLLLANDLVHLRPLESSASSGDDHGWCEARTERFVSRLGLEYGALGNKGLIRNLLERSTSDASIHQTLEVVFPPPPPQGVAADHPSKDCIEQQQEENAAEGGKLLCKEPSLSLSNEHMMRRKSTTYDITGLCGVRGQTDQVELFKKQQNAMGDPPRGERSAGGDGGDLQSRRLITLAELDAIISASNGTKTAQF